MRTSPSYCFIKGGDEQQPYQWSPQCVQTSSCAKITWSTNWVCSRFQTILQEVHTWWNNQEVLSGCKCQPLLCIGLNVIIIQNYCNFCHYQLCRFLLSLNLEYRSNKKYLCNMFPELPTVLIKVQILRISDQGQGVHKCIKVFLFLWVLALYDIETYWGFLLKTSFRGAYVLKIGHLPMSI